MQNSAKTLHVAHSANAPFRADTADAWLSASPTERPKHSGLDHSSLKPARDSAPRTSVASWWTGFLALLVFALGVWTPVAESAITYLGQSSANTGQSPATSLTLAKPTGAAVGEVLVAIIGGAMWGGNSTAFAAPAGWTAINTTTYGSLNLPAFYHVVQAGDPASWTWTTASAQSLNGTLLRYSGVNTGTPLDVGAAATDSTQTTTPIAPSVTTVTAGARVIRAYAATTGVPTANPATSRVMVRMIGNGVNRPGFPGDQLR